MMHPSLLRENVDGEALLWAEDRLRSHPSGRRVLVVLSDGASVDDSTLNENGRSYLERHLQKAVSEIDERQTAVLCAIGLDFRVDRYYRRATFVDDPKALPAAVLRAIGAAMMTQAIGQDKKRLVQHES